MKKSILALAIAAVFAACNSTPKPEDITAANTNTTIDRSAADTAGTSQFDQWKEEQKTVTMDGVTADAEVSQPAPQQTVAAAPATKIIYRDRPASTPRVAKTTQTRTYGTPGNPSREAVSRDNAGSANSGSGDASTADTGTGVGVGTGVSDEPAVATEPAEVPEVVKNKGWSKAAKGTAIGAGSGAVLGAIISKKKGTGAVVGGIIGAAGGYVLGKKQDKKDGRY